MSQFATGKITPIILVHAITASGLHDQYPIDQERCWSPKEMMFKEFDRIFLYPATGVPDGSLRYEAKEPSLVRASEMFSVIYSDLIAELRHNLSWGPTPTQPVYPFVYDWRQSNFRTITQLRNFVEEIIERTNLMPRESTTPLCDSVDLIGHSMGGLVIAGCIAEGSTTGWSSQRVRRVVTLGTPFRGANAAIQKLATGGGSLFGREGRERERTAARVTPSAYQLLPSFDGALADGRDIWDTGTYQPSILESITEFVAQTHADAAVRRDLVQCATIAETLFAEMLDTGKRYRALTDSVEPAMLRPDGQWLAIVGAGEPTLIKTGFSKDPQGNARFDFDKAAFTSKTGWKSKTWDTGDETVPLSGAEPPWDEAWRNTVVVTRGDFATFGEMGDSFLRRAMGLHAALPLLDLAQRWIINFLRPEWTDPAGPTPPGQHGKLWGETLPDFPASQTKQKVWSALVPGLKLS